MGSLRDFWRDLTIRNLALSIPLLLDTKHSEWFLTRLLGPRCRETRTSDGKPCTYRVFEADAVRHHGWHLRGETGPVYAGDSDLQRRGMW